jgi:hypothetical protein
VDGDHTEFWTGHAAITAFGIVTVVFWLSQAVFPQVIPPLVPLPNFQGVAREVRGVAPSIREQVPSLNEPDRELVASLHREVLTAVAVRWAQIAAGVVSGVLIARQRRTGKWLAIALCTLLLALFLIAQCRLAWSGNFTASWAAKAHFVPRLMLHSLVTLLFYSATVAYLTRRQVALRFASRRA